MAAGPDLASPFFVRWNTVGGAGNFLMVLFEAIPPPLFLYVIQGLFWPFFRPKKRTTLQ